jgi:hypothetical protein
MLALMSIAYLLASRGLKAAVVDGPMLFGIGATLFAMILNFFAYLTCIFRGRKRTNMVWTRFLTNPTA